MSRVLPFVYTAVLGLEVLVLTVVYAVWTPASSDPFGVWLGTLGLLSMVVMLVYSIARRSRLLRRVARLSTWLHFHIFMGVQGVVFVFFHSLPLFLRLPSAHLLNPGVLNLLACLTVFASGIFGRYLFAQVPKTLGGRHMALKDVDAELATAAAGVPDEVVALWRDPPDAGSVFGLISADLSRRSALRALRRAKLSKELRALATRRIRLARQRAVLKVGQRWFRSWIILHRPIAAALYVLSMVHIALALMFSNLRFY